ncbi:MAG: protein kinase [Planctomycetaceae bacterium]
MSDSSSRSPAQATVTPDPQSVEGLFLAALAQASAAEREAFLTEACGDDAERRRRVEALLSAYEDAGSFLERSPVHPFGTTSFNLDFLTPSDDPGLLGLLGPYEVYEILGRGGMGIVFRARDPKLNRVVAIKVLAPELAANPLARRRFLREAQAAAAISHPHVVTIHAVDEGTSIAGAPHVSTPAAQSSRGASPINLPYLVMECIVGQPLQQTLDKQGSLRLTETQRIGHQLASGLAAAHKQGLIHRDIKPANVLLENGVERVKITDFGLARLVDDVSITRTGEVSGTPQYMSPEQAAGDPVDHRSDLFSLGCVLYAMCTGRSPFRATSLAAAIRRVCDDSPRPIEEINPEVPAWLIDLINQLLEKNPNDRPQSAEEIASFLGDRLAGLQLPPASSKPSVLIAPRPTASRAVPIASPVPSDRRIGYALIVAGAAFLIIPWLMAAAIRLIQGRVWNMAMGGQLFVSSALGLLAMLIGWATIQVFGRPARADLSPQIAENGERGRRNALGRALILLGSLIIGGVIVAFAYVAVGLPDLPPFEGRDFGTTIILILLIAFWPLLIGLFLRSRLTGPPRPTVRRPADRPWDIRRVGPTAIWAGLGVIALPWLPIAYGSIVGDGDPMEFGGRFVIPAAILGVLTIMLGCVTLLIAYAVGQRHPNGSAADRPWRDPAHAQMKSPWNVLGWMIVGGMVLIPLLLVMLITSYAVTRQAATARYNSAAAADAARMRENLVIAEAERQRQPDVLRAEAERLSIQQRREWEAAATATFRFDPAALGHVGLSMYRTDSDSANKVDDIRPSETLIRAGNLVMLQSFQAGAVNEIRLPPGTYEVRVHGREFGWSNGTAWLAMSGMFGDVEFNDTAVSIVSTVEIHDGDDSRVSRLEYNWQDMARRQPRWTGSPATHNFYWNGKAYAVNLLQGQVIQKLLIAFAAGSPEVPKTDLTVDLNRTVGGMMGAGGAMEEDFDEGFGMMGMAAPLFVEAVFDNGRHPAWGTLIVPAKTEGHYRLAEPQIPPPALDEPPVAEDEFDPFQSGPVESPQPLPSVTDPHADAANPTITPEQSDRLGVLNVDIRDDGLIVALRRKSAFGGFVPGSEQQVSDVGYTELKLAPGEYEVLTRDTHFGWGDRTKTITVGREFQELVIRRVLTEYVKRSGAELDTQFVWTLETFLWDGERYSLPNGAARVALNWLLEAYADGKPDVEEQSLLERLIAIGGQFEAIGATEPGAFFGTRRSESLEEVFKMDSRVQSSGKPAWGNLVIPGETPGTYRLKPVPRGTLTVTIIDEGMQAFVRPVDEDARVSKRSAIGVGAHSWELPPGEYKVSVADIAVGFYAAGSTVRTEFVVLNDGESTEIHVDRRLSDYLQPMEPQRSSVVHFRWFPRSQNDVFNLKLDQAECIRVLLQALADGQSEVAEAELLQRAGVRAESLGKLFYGVDAPDRESAIWKNLIIPGETEGTYRLKPVPDAASPIRRDDAGTAPGDGAPTTGDAAPPAPPMPMDDLPVGEETENLSPER